MTSDVGEFNSDDHYIYYCGQESIMRNRFKGLNLIDRVPDELWMEVRDIVHSLKASIIECSAFFIFQLSHPCMTTGKTIALTRQTFVGKITSLLFYML